MKGIYLVIADTNKFKEYTLVKFIANSNSGRCYLVADINDDNNREWIMDYNLYPTNLKNHNFPHTWNYNETYEQIIKNVLK